MVRFRCQIFEPFSYNLEKYEVRLILGLSVQKQLLITKSHTAQITLHINVNTREGKNY